MAAVMWGDVDPPRQDRRPVCWSPVAAWRRRRRTPAPVGLCDVCERWPASMVVDNDSAPFGARVDVCSRCLRLSAWPWWLLVAVAVEAGGVAEVDAEWGDSIAATCAVLHRTRADYERAVADALGEGTS